ncbi:MAG: sugar kinase [Thaumarchaeota archaeon]|nr:sugar kinase [Nitrososphaerota archaeon]MDD9808259.1 sugar kinase [Nitrososphaerota archaeon]MDD9826300.1 sugar kinase [Nitrososphaerota archaeon]MDD9842289.1 sugar kinase [Nitrososphaerota archaeon]RNJ71780.1 MAG: sugar kinase [Thaumarchaeota archaeon S13]
MRAGVYGQGGRTTPRSIVADLEWAGIDAFAAGPRRQAREADIAVVLGGDRGVRAYFHGRPESEVPVLGLGEGESGGLLASLDVRSLRSHAGRLASGRYTVDAMPRIGVSIDGRRAHPALNDVAVFASRSAMLMEHELRIDGEAVWHDNGDGVIVATPMGSSAYSMSAGGPAIFPGTRAFGIVPVNSLDVTRRPLMVPDTSEISVSGISSKTHCEAVLDGIERLAVRDAVTCTRTPHAANVVRLGSAAPAMRGLAKKVDLAGDLLRMSPSSKLILTALEYGGKPMTLREISARTLLPPRTMRFALRHLTDNGLVKRRVSGRDSRQAIYELAQRS